MLKKYWLLLGVFCSTWAMAVPYEIKVVQEGGLVLRGWYTPQALELGLEGEVQLSAVVSPTGQITNIKIIKSSGHAILDRAAIQSARQAKVKVHVINGQAVERQYRFSMSYRIKKDELVEAEVSK